MTVLEVEGATRIVLVSVTLVVLTTRRDPDGAGSFPLIVVATEVEVDAVPIAETWTRRISYTPKTTQCSMLTGLETLFVSVFTFGISTTGFLLSTLRFFAISSSCVVLGA